MNILELDTYDLGDAVKFNDQLNPRLFDDREQLRPEVREQLLKIAEDFAEFLGVTDLELKDITISGSNAAYTYTPHSDIDLHLVVDLPEADRNEVYRELFDAKKYAYNDMHNITIGGYDVELYVQDANKTHVSQGIYSVLNNDWVSVPKRQKPAVDDISVKSKFEDLGHRIEAVIKTGDFKKISAMAERIKEYRQAGLDAHGEFGAENLAFKILRTQGLIEKLYAARNRAKDELLSLDERKKKKKRVRYGYGGYWYPGTAYAGQDHPAGTEGGDAGGGDGGGESLKEDQATPTDEDILQDFVNFCVKELKIEQMPRIRLRRDPQWSKVHKTFGRYIDDNKTLEVAWGQRHIMDVLRTVAHELTHKHQHEREGERMGPDAGETGSPYENEANARAGVLMRDYGRLHPEYFGIGQAHNLSADQLKEFSPEGYRQRYSLYMDDYAIDEHYADLEDAIEAVEAYKRDDPKSRYADYNIRDYNGQVVWRNDAWQDYQKPGKIQFLPPNDVAESASGYIPTKKQARDPRFSMALTQDIRPGQVGKEANKLKLKTDRQGHPQIARANGLFEQLMAEYQEIKEGIETPVTKNTDEQQYLKFILAKVNSGRILNRHEQRWLQDYQLKKKLAEFAPSPDRDDDGQGPDYLTQLANRWWNAADPQDQNRIADVIRTFGYEITQVESEDDAVQLTDRKSGHTYFISADDFDPDLYEAEKQSSLDTYEDVDPAWVARVAKRVIPDIRARVTGEGYAHLRTPGGLNLAIGVNIHAGDITVSIGSDVGAMSSSGDVKGAVTAIIRAVYDAAVKKYGQPPNPGTLSIDHDSSHGTWQHIAQKLGLNYGAHRINEISDERLQDYLHRAGKRVDSRLERMSQARQRLNKGYEIYHAEDPTRIVHKFEANTPAEARRYYEKYNANYESDRDYDLRLRRATGLMESEQELDEVNMSPSALEKFATSPEAKGIKAGFEAELIFRDTQGESDEMDPEPDYDADERAYSIQQVIEFFDNDEYGYGLSDRQRRRLEDELDETYMNWRDEQMYDAWRDERDERIRDYFLEEQPMAERVHAMLVDGMDLSDEEADRIQSAGTKAPKFTSSKEQDAYTNENPDYKVYLEAVNDAETILEEEVESCIASEDGIYDNVLDDFRNDFNVDDDSSFFSDVGLRWMSDVANEYNLDWPVWNMDSRGNSGSRDWDSIAEDLSEVIDMPVKVSSGYHSMTRREGQWIMEPDSSLSPDDPGDEAGIEIVSPPMPLLVAIEKLKQVTEWANDQNRGNAYTNSSTGLHMGVSLPTRGGDVDYVKLILFMGDKYVQEQFGREANTYCASALDKLRQNIKGKRSDPAGVVKLLQHGLTELAHKELQKGVGTSKYTSAHIQPGYIEFRSPGGDWLAAGDAEIGVLENTMMRFARAMAIAGDPSAERQEYAKKLYKLVTEENPEYADQLKLFAEFAAGAINKEQLKKQWAERTIGTEKKMNQRWKLYQKVDGTWTSVPGAEWNGYTENEVKNAVWSKYGREALDTGEYQLVNMGEQDWEVYDVKTGKTLEVVKGKNKGEVADAVYDKYVAQGIGFQVRPYEDPATMTPRAKLAKRIVQPKKEPAVDDDRASDWEAVYRPTGRVFDTLAHADAEQAATWKSSVMRDHGFTNADDIEIRRKGTKPAEQQALDANDVPVWEIYERETGHVVHTFSNLEHSSAWTQAQQWLRDIGAEPATWNAFSVRAKTIPNQQTADARRDSATLQRNLGVRDVEPDVAQNFDPSAYERNSDRIEAIRAQAQQPRQNYELVSDEDPDRVIHRMPNATADEVRAWISQQEQGGMPPGFLRTRIVAEAIDPVSGAGAVPPRLDPKNTSKKTVEPVEKTFKNPVKGLPYRSAIGQAISQRDLENMTSQIQMARKLGDSIMEMEDPPPEVLKALDQAAQKNGYQNWADVKANPRSESAIMTVAKLANTILRTTTPVHHEKIFYKNKTDENFADGKKPGRKGLAKRMGVNCKQPVSKLRKIAKNSSGERARMAHWCANMKSGKSKKK